MFVIRAAVLAGLCMSVSQAALLCGKIYYLQGGQQTIRAVTKPALATTVATTEVTGALGGLTILSNGTDYRILTEYNGSCEYEKHAVGYRHRSAGASAWAAEKDSNLYVKAFSGSRNGLAGADFDYWFGFKKVANDSGVYPLTYAIGRATPTSPFFLWYAAATLIDSTRDSTTNRWYFKSALSSTIAQAHYDSSYIDSLVRSAMDTVTFDGTNARAVLKVQMVKVLYDTIVPTVRTSKPYAHEARGAQHSAIALTAAGARSWISLTSGSAPATLSLCSPAGRTIARAHVVDGSYRLDNGMARLPRGTFVARSGATAVGTIVVR